MFFFFSATSMIPMNAPRSARPSINFKLKGSVTISNMSVNRVVAPFSYITSPAPTMVAMSKEISAFLVIITRIIAIAGGSKLISSFMHVC